MPRLLKVPNPKTIVDYGVKDAHFWYSRNEGGSLRKTKDFWPFANERQATACAKRLEGGIVVREVKITCYEVDA